MVLTDLISNYLPVGNVGYWTLQRHRGRALVTLPILSFSAEWDSDVPPSHSPPEIGIEIRRSFHTSYGPLQGLIIPKKVFSRSLNVPQNHLRSWLVQNWSKIQVAMTPYHNAFPPQTKVCLVLTEYITDSWTAVFDDFNTVHAQWLSIAIGLANGQEGLVWDRIRLRRPTMNARLAMGDEEVEPRVEKC